jgi:hypothetical protein
MKTKPCDEHKTKYKISIVYFSLLLVFIVFKDYLFLETYWYLLIPIMLFGLVASAWIHKYLNCLNDYNNKNKPPFQKSPWNY